MKNVSNNALRPNSLNDFIGQTQLKEKLKIYIYSAKERKQSLDHLLFYGPPGTGKTSLAYIIANELNVKIKVVSAPSIKIIGDLIGILSILDPGDILFIDEIHRLDKEIEEMFYSVIEDFKLNVTIKSSEQSKLINFDVSPFTLIGATTEVSLISRPLRERFGITFKFNYYLNEELGQIIQNNFNKFGFKIDFSNSLEIAKRSRKTPRIANNFVKRIVDFTIFYNTKEVNKDILTEAFRCLEIDESGLDKNDYEILLFMYNKFKNIPISLEIISNYINENVNTIKEVYERFLVYEGFIERTKRGRILTKKGIEKCEEFLKNQNKQ